MPASSSMEGRRRPKGSGSSSGTATTTGTASSAPAGAGAGLGGPPLDAAEREAALADFFAAHGLDADAAFSRRLVESLEN